jgi:DnaJ-class molecular chaperone
MYFIALNGPPGCGKDTAAEMLQHHAQRWGYGVNLEKLANPIRQMAYAMVGGGEDRQYDDFKLRTHAPFQRTGRQLMIDISESFMKEQYGKSIFAELLLQRCSRKAAGVIHIVSDAGFQQEVSYLAALGHEVVTVNILRPGCNFDGDSRQWVRSPHQFRETFMLDNKAGLEELSKQCESLWRYAKREFQN